MQYSGWPPRLAQRPHMAGLPDWHNDHTCHTWQASQTGTTTTHAILWLASQRGATTTHATLWLVSQTGTTTTHAILWLVSQSGTTTTHATQTRRTCRRKWNLRRTVQPGILPGTVFDPEGHCESTALAMNERVDRLTSRANTLAYYTASQGRRVERPRAVSEYAHARPSQHQ